MPAAMRCWRSLPPPAACSDGTWGLRVPGRVTAKGASPRLGGELGLCAERGQHSSKK